VGRGENWAHLAGVRALRDHHKLEVYQGGGEKKEGERGRVDGGLRFGTFID